MPAWFTCDIMLILIHRRQKADGVYAMKLWNSTSIGRSVNWVPEVNNIRRHITVTSLKSLCWYTDILCEPVVIEDVLFWQTRGGVTLQMCLQPAQGNGVVWTAGTAQSVNTHTSNSPTSVFKHTKCNFDHVLFSLIMIIIYSNHVKKIYILYSNAHFCYDRN